MMKQTRFLLTMLLSLVLLMAVTACRGRSVQTPEAPAPVDVAATAVAVAAAEQANAIAATAAAVAQQQGSAALATLEASDAPDANLLRQKLAAAQPDEHGNVALTFTEAEVNQVIQYRLALAAHLGHAAEIPLHNPVVAFSGGNVVLTGDVTQPVTGRLTAHFRPYVVNGLPQFELVSATLGRIPVPTALLSTAETTLNDSLGQMMAHLPAGIQLMDIVIGEGTITVVARHS